MTRFSPDPRKDRPLAVSSWVVYDLANTVFYAVVVTRYLPVQLKELTGKHFIINLGFYPSMLCAAFLAPWLGRYVGAKGVSRATVGLFTLACCVFTAALGLVDSPAALILFFALAQVFYQLALVPYNNLLPSVASSARMGLVSGAGVGVGYAGVLLALPLADLAIRLCGHSYKPAYFVAAVLFFLFTLPLLFFVPEEKTVDQEKPLNLSGVLALLKVKSCRRFIAGNFLCSDALNALLALITVYLSTRLRLDDAALLRLLMALNVSALISGFLFGVLTDRLAPRRTMPLAALLLMISVAVTHFSGSETAAFWFIVLLGGPGVAGLWVAGRKWVVHLAPPGDVGTLFGFYGLSNKLSLVNLTLFTLLADWTGSYTASVWVLLISLALGMILLLRVERS